MRKNAAAIELIEGWLKDESGYDEETFPQLKQALEDSRRTIAARALLDE